MDWINAKLNQASETVECLLAVFVCLPFGLLYWGLVANNEQIFNVGAVWIILELAVLIVLGIDDANRRPSGPSQPDKTHRITAEVKSAQASLRKIQTICNEPDSR